MYLLINHTSSQSRIADWSKIMEGIKGTKKNKNIKQKAEIQSKSTEQEEPKKT